MCPSFFLEQNLWTTSTLYYGMRLSSLMPPRCRHAAAPPPRAVPSLPPYKTGLRCSVSGSRQPGKIVNWIFWAPLSGNLTADNNFRHPSAGRVIYEIKSVEGQLWWDTHSGGIKCGLPTCLPACPNTACWPCLVPGICSSIFFFFSFPRFWLCTRKAINHDKSFFLFFRTPFFFFLASPIFRWKSAIVCALPQWFSYRKDFFQTFLILNLF